MAGAPMGRRLLEISMATTLPRVYGQIGRAPARGQCWNLNGCRVGGAMLLATGGGALRRGVFHAYLGVGWQKWKVLFHNKHWCARRGMGDVLEVCQGVSCLSHEHKQLVAGMHVTGGVLRYVQPHSQEVLGALIVGFSQGD